MCGIVYAHDFEGNPVNNGILNQFDDQRGRGTQGFGVYDGIHNNIIKATKEDKILKWLVKYESSLILFHHRFPTSTDNTRNTAHPFTTKDYFGDNEYILVHNGHISNCYMLKQDHEKLGIKYTGVVGHKFNDSESLLWDVALFLEGKQDHVKAYGGMAFVCIKLVKGKLDKLYFGRNTYPLNMLKVEKGIMLSSTGPGTSIESDTLYTWNYELKRLTNRKVAFPNWKSETEKVKPMPNSYYREWKPNAPQSNVQSYMQQLQDEENELNQDLDAPDYKFSFDSFEVENTCLKYLIACAGHFQTAYDAMDMESMNLDDETDDESIRHKELLWAAMDCISYDKEWHNQDSISSMFDSIDKVKEALDARTLRLPLPA